VSSAARQQDGGASFFMHSRRVGVWDEATAAAGIAQLGFDFALSSGSLTCRKSVRMYVLL
jgi:hypothetical protein